MMGQRGIGDVTSLPLNIFGTSYIDCTVMGTWLIEPPCWSKSISDWQAVKSAIAIKPSDYVAPAAVPLAYTTSPVYAGDASQQMAQYNLETSNVLNTAFTQSQANVLASSQQDAPGNPAGCPMFQALDSTGQCSISSWVWIAGAGLLMVLMVSGRRR